MTNKLKQIVFPVILFVVSLIGIHFFIPDYHPFGGIEINKDPEVIIKQTGNELKNLGVSFESKKFRLQFYTDENFVNYINSEFRLNEANEILRKAGTAYYWLITQSGDDDSSITISSNSDNNMVEKNETLKLKLTNNGRIFSFAQKIKPLSVRHSFNLQEAKIFAEQFLKKVRPDIIIIDDTTQISDIKINTFYFKEIETFQKQNRNDYKITWENESKAGFNNVLSVMLVGDQIGEFSIQPKIPEDFAKKSPEIFEIVRVIIYLLLIIVSVIVIGFKRFRAFEIGFKKAIVFGVFILVVFIFKQLFDRYLNYDTNLIIGLIVGGIFIGGASIILWAVSETVFREIWNEKFLSLDLMFNKKLTHSVLNKAILNGFSFAAGFSFLFFILIRLISIGLNISFYGDGFTSQSEITAYFPALNILFGVINSYALLAVSFFMFLIAAVKRFINNDIIFILISGLIWAIFIQSNIASSTVSISVNFIFGILLSLILIKYDLLTTLLTYLLSEFFIKASELSFIQIHSLQIHWIITIIISSGIVLYSIIFFLRKDKFSDYESITPKFVENVTERQRLRKELDVARHVQMSFLPKENPQIKGIDISSVCIPALEVGGDYYDFISLGEKKIGIIIGDVSGKGTQAAFYMTLTKGFLKALAKQTDSPSEVLSRMNELFYENVERGTFISMIYAVIDLELENIRIARAGHNPVILKDISGDIKLITPDGLALGLERGKLFRKVITESEEKLIPGKNFIFYTDGFTEAVNKRNDEYGLERLENIVKINDYKSAKEILENIGADVRKFIGKAKQHDDMTMIVIKIVK